MRIINDYPFELWYTWISLHDTYLTCLASLFLWNQASKFQFCIAQYSQNSNTNNKTTTSSSPKKIQSYFNKISFLNKTFVVLERTPHVFFLSLKFNKQTNLIYISEIILRIYHFPKLPLHFEAQLLNSKAVARAFWEKRV